VSSALRLVIFIVPALWLSTRPGFELHHLWYVSVATMFIQAVVSYLFLRREFRRKLPIAPSMVQAA
jgi:Na+-driven multidrug efflux pump